MFDVKKAEKLAEELLRKTGEPSVSMSIYDKGVTSHICLGYSDVENKIKTDENTFYAIGSCTKAFTSAALAILADEGKINIDDKIKKYIPEFEMYDKYVEQDITIRDILCHRSGLPRHDLAWYLYADTITFDDLIKKIKFLKPDTPFRYKMQYNNIMYELAGYLIERVSGQKWQEFVSDRIAGSIGMKAIKYSAAENDNTCANTAKGYYCNRETKELIQMPYFNFKNIGAAGSIYTSTADLIKWVAMNLNYGKADGKQIISESNIKECQRSQSIIRSMISDDPFDGYRLFSTYGLGWFVECHRGHTLVRHGGNINGFSSSVGFLPDEQFGFSILCNSEGSLLPDALTYFMLDLYYNQEYVDWYEINKAYRIQLFEKMSSMEESIDKPDKKEAFKFPLHNAVGVYNFPGYGEIVITEDEAGLKYEFGNSKGSIEHITNNFFEMKSPDDSILFEFRIDVDGNVVSIESNLEPSIGEKICFKRI